jgi:hypothetical protein
MTADNSWGVAHKGGNQTDPVYVANLRWIGYSSQFGLPFHSHMVYALSVLDGTVKGGRSARASSLHRPVQQACDQRP